MIEIVFDRAFTASRYEDDLLYSSFARLSHHVVNERPVHDGQELLRHRFRGGQNARAKACDRNDDFADRFHEWSL